MWSRSQCRESRRQPGKTQWASRRITCSRMASGGSCWSTDQVWSRSSTGRTLMTPPVSANRASHRVSRSVVAAPSFSMVAAPVSPVRSATRSSGVRWTKRWVVAAAAMRGSGVLASGHQVEGVLGVGQDPCRAGAAYVEWVGVAELTEVVGDPGDALVEQLGVGGVQGHQHVSGGRRAAGLDPDSALLEGACFVVGGAVGVEVEPGLVDQCGGVDLADPLGGGRDHPVGVVGGLEGEVVGLTGDRAGPPDRHAAGADVVPQAGQPVA